ncbi:trace amine-associated receptor 13c-like [Fundulus heteroclitus]|uniref:trace amine-associated receptor 13c-like n=1 Tax=Fundulus heteroclitus TaxID=8078 RepID=UPI00165ADD89|nr:trace amine-associated receptor 13c-like [Fundulus heteroclitus]
MIIRDSADLCYPHLYNNSCKKPSLPWTEVVPVQITLALISMITVALNLLVIISVSHFRQLHTPTNILLFSLAVSDLLVGFISMPGEIYQNTSCWFLGDNICFLYNYLCYIIPSTSVGDMVLISIDRYVAICDPLHYQTRVTKRRVKVCVCLCWLCSVVYNILFLKDDLIQAGWNNSCYGECVTAVDLISGTFYLVFTFFAPVTIIIVLYMKVFVVAVSQARAMRSHITAVKLQHSVKTIAKKSELKAARTLGVLVVLFLITFCPAYCVYLAGVESFSDSSVFAVDFLFYFNSCVNPVIYALFYPWFRKTVKLIVTLQILKPGSCETIIQSIN